ncbi:MAG TPA: alpha/beta hydrolase-fold protein [Ktedonobacteraceae bacterium]|nr:alpha/beta hydrolase-fold protein [Ktedonobacteraceae bacterium]
MKDPLPLRQLLPIARQASLLWALASLLAVLVSSLLLFTPQVIGLLVSFIINAEIDEMRARFIAALLITAAIGFCGGFVGRRRAATCGGAMLAFIAAYLVGFIGQVLQPHRDPAGQLETLNVWELAHTVAMMIALALLCAFIGAAVGAALSQVFFDPLLYLPGLFRRRQMSAKRQQMAMSQAGAGSLSRTVMMIVGAIVMIAALALASGSTNLFIYAPDLNLYQAPGILRHSQLPTHGTIVADTVVSRALGGQRRPFLVYLPPSYNTPQGLHRRYPTLYLLHGSPGKDSDWIVGGKANESVDTLIAEGKIAELILVMPDGNGRPGESSEWGNSGDGRQLMENFIVDDLVPYVDHKYRTLTDAAHRGIGGNSMGAFGATNIAVHHPDIFGVVISLGGYFHATGSIWGHNPAYLRANSPADILPHDPQAWRLRMYIGTATKDKLYKDSLQFVQELRKLHMTYRLDVQPGYHAWSVWQSQLYNALLWMVPLP